MSRAELVNQLLQEAEEFDRWAKSFEEGKLALLENGVPVDRKEIVNKYRRLATNCRTLAQQLRTDAAEA